jgi:acyl-CoA thioesterase-1
MVLVRLRASRIATYFYYDGDSTMIFHVGRLFVVIAMMFAAACGQAAQETKKETSAPAVERLEVDSEHSDHRPVLLVVGDSISAGYGLPPGNSYPDVMQRALDAEHIPWHVVNQGVSGDTTAGGAARITAGLNTMPKVVLLELGGNDGLRGMPLATTRANLEKMITIYQKAGAQVVLAGMTLPPNYGPDYIKGFEQIYKDLAAKYKVKLIPFLLSDIVTKDMHYFQPDGIHPTEEGAKIVAKTALKTLQPLLK